jgi:hypothetical protein
MVEPNDRIRLSGVQSRRKGFLLDEIKATLESRYLVMNCFAARYRQTQ